MPVSVESCGMHVSLSYVLLCVSVPAGYGFVDFDSPASAQKAVTALKAGGVQAQMAKVRSPPYENIWWVYFFTMWCPNNSNCWSALDYHSDNVVIRRSAINSLFSHSTDQHTSKQ